MATGVLRSLHNAAIRAVEGGHSQYIGPEAAHGLDQEMIGALVECLSRDSIAAGVRRAALSRR